MPRTCTICAHPQRTDIESAIASNTSYRTIAGRYGTSKSSVERHALGCVKQAIESSQQARQAASGIDVVSQLKTINAVIWNIIKEARADKKNSMALFAVDRLLKQLELQSKLLGDLDERPQINLLVSPEWANVREIIFKALADFPEARIAVAQALMQEAESGRRIA